MDRNQQGRNGQNIKRVALRKESVDRNNIGIATIDSVSRSLSARRAWIEMPKQLDGTPPLTSLSARRAWIEIPFSIFWICRMLSLSARRAWIEIAKSTPEEAKR